MNLEELKINSEILIDQLEESIKDESSFVTAKFLGAWFEAKQFLIDFAGQNSNFTKMISDYPVEGRKSLGSKERMKHALLSFISYTEKGLNGKPSLQRQAELDVVSDYLSQAHELIMDSKVHPAAPAVLIGASLEEFLRNWVEELLPGTDTTNTGIDGLSKMLKEKELLDKQDMKDITSWAGIRNDAAHGRWDNVNDMHRIQIMLESVNHFIRIKTAAKGV